MRQFKRQIDLVKPLLTIVLVQGQRVHLADLFLAKPHPATHTVRKPITNLAQLSGVVVALKIWAGLHLRVSPSWLKSINICNTSTLVHIY